MAAPIHGVGRDRPLLLRLERTLADIQASGTISETLLAALESIVRSFGEELGLQGGRIYRREGPAYVLEHHFGPSGTARRGLRIPASYAAIRKLRTQGYVLMDRHSPEFDPTIEASLGVSHFAAIAVDQDAQYLIAFSVRDGGDEQLASYALNAVRHVLNVKTRGQHLEGLLEQARRIQATLVPFEPPRFPGYEIDGRNVASDVVGGDVYDYIPVSRRVLGVVIADAAGSGLPAALQSRDVLIGMRMGVEDGLKIVRTVEKLNRVIHHGSLDSRFVSFFYVEIESNGNILYINAGHCSPMLLTGERTFRLRRGGIVLGPTPNATYERGFHVMEPGDLLAMFTDGITEASNDRGEEYGEDRLLDRLQGLRHQSAQRIVDAVFEDVMAFSRRSGHPDDRTLVIVKRTGTADTE